jgi:CRP-like cAMP-binding protein
MALGAKESDMIITYANGTTSHVNLLQNEVSNFFETDVLRVEMEKDDFLQLYGMMSNDPNRAQHIAFILGARLPESEHLEKIKESREPEIDLKDLIEAMEADPQVVLGLRDEISQLAEMFDIEIDADRVAERLSAHGGVASARRKKKPPSPGARPFLRHKFTPYTGAWQVSQNKNTLFSLQPQGVNRFDAQFMPGRDDNDKRVDDAEVAHAARIAANAMTMRDTLEDCAFAISAGLTDKNPAHKLFIDEAQQLVMAFDDTNVPRDDADSDFPWKRTDATVYALNDKGVNRLTVMVNPGRDIDGERLSDDETRQIAHQIQLSSALAQAVGVADALLRNTQPETGTFANDDLAMAASDARRLSDCLRRYRPNLAPSGP